MTMRKETNKIFIVRAVLFCGTALILFVLVA